MSVSISLLPIALAMRIVMGKEKFENWVKAQQIIIPSKFETELELLNALRKAGYDAIKYGKSFKTHLDGEKEFIFWNKYNNHWQAVFPKYIDESIRRRFMSHLESSSDSRIFDPELISEDMVKKFPTNFCDTVLLTKALSEFGAAPVVKSNGEIFCKIEKSILVFSRIDNSPFEVEVRGTPNLADIHQYLTDIDDDYKRCVQTLVYKKIKARAAESNMVVESEEVLEDKTIIVTLLVR